MVLLSQHGSSEIGMVMDQPYYTAGKFEEVLAECCVGMIYMPEECGESLETGSLWNSGKKNRRDGWPAA